ncbi:MAG: GNAT family N-acetyltransferase [Clostridia bacterium]|nr:GNAT family N-acetyltransferase [Clostridia bacterium]
MDIHTRDNENMKSTMTSGLRIENVLFSKHKKQIKEIYIDSFPKEERMPFGMMIFMTCFITTKFFAYYDGDTLCGFIYMAKIGRQIFILFFAVDEKLRSKGYGAKILGEIRARYPKCNIVVSIEHCGEDAPELELRQRRKGFYMRNGYSDSGYNIKLAGVEQELLVSGGEFNKVRFTLFLLGYSCLAIIPKIWKRT